MHNKHYEQKRDKIKREEVCSLSSFPLSNFEGLLCKKNVDSFSRFFASFPLIFRFSNWSRFSFLFLKTQSLSPLLQFYSKYFIDFHVFLFLFFVIFLFRVLLFFVISFHFIVLKWQVVLKLFAGLNVVLWNYIINDYFLWFANRQFFSHLLLFFLCLDV